MILVGEIVEMEFVHQDTSSKLLKENGYSMATSIVGLLINRASSEGPSIFRAFVCQSLQISFAIQGLPLSILPKTSSDGW